MFPKPVEIISQQEVTFILGRPNGSAHIPPSEVEITAGFGSDRAGFVMLLCVRAAVAAAAI